MSTRPKRVVIRSMKFRKIKKVKNSYFSRKRSVGWLLSWPRMSKPWREYYTFPYSVCPCQGSLFRIPTQNIVFPRDEKFNIFKSQPGKGKRSSILSHFFSLTEREEKIWLIVASIALSLPLLKAVQKQNCKIISVFLCRTSECFFEAQFHLQKKQDKNRKL